MSMQGQNSSTVQIKSAEGRRTWVKPDFHVESLAASEGGSPGYRTTPDGVRAYHS